MHIFMRCQFVLALVIILVSCDVGVPEAYTHLRQGVQYIEKGDSEQAKAAFRQALKLAKDSGDKESMAKAYSLLGYVYRDRGELEQAEAMYRKAVPLFEVLDDKAGIAQIYKDLGLVYQTRGELEQAEAMHHQALALFETLGDKENTALAHVLLGAIHHVRDELDKAETAYYTALALFEAVENKKLMAGTYHNLGRVHHGQGKLEQAREAYTEALNLFQELGAEPQSTQSRADLGWLYVQSGKLNKGIPLLLKSPAEPSYRSSALFPEADSSVERRQRYTETLKAFNEGLDGTRLILGHIFVAHLSTEPFVDQALIAEMQALVRKTESPLIYDALRELSYDQHGHRDWHHQLEYAEAALHRIEALNLDVPDAEHLSHFYYNAACGHSLAKNYEMSAKRLREAFSLDHSLRSWSLRDPDLENLRIHLGIEEFKKVIGEVG